MESNIYSGSTSVLLTKGKKTISVFARTIRVPPEALGTGVSAAVLMKIQTPRPGEVEWYLETGKNRFPLPTCLRYSSTLTRIIVIKRLKAITRKI